MLRNLIFALPLLMAIPAIAAQSSKLKRKFSGLTDHVLSQRFRELENEGLINKQIYRELQPHPVFYTITNPASELLEISGDLCKWSQTRP